MKINNSQEAVNKVLQDFKRTSQDYFSFEDFKTKLLSGKQMRIKYGVDVTAGFLHLGHAVNLWMMRKLQELGHKVVFLIGDFTTRIGDPTGKSDTRPIIPLEEIEKNALEFIKQVSNVLITDNPDVFEIRRNSEWFDKMGINEFLGLLSMVTHARLISRDMFQKRLEEEKDIYMHEMIYPILQGYDSKMLDSDLTIVGSDQLFNEMMGKFYQEKFGQPTQTVITTKITMGLDGKNKQSKSLNNYIALNEASKNMYGKAMSMPDNQVLQWLEVYTDMNVSDIEVLKQKLENGLNPRESKMILAKLLVERYYGTETANSEEDWFVNTFSNRDFPEDAREITIEAGNISLIDFIKKIDDKKSNRECRKLLSNGSLRINGEKQTVQSYNFQQGAVYQVKLGKKTHIKFIVQ
jgi:tyrosyl-tRNA synthetase